MINVQHVMICLNALHAHLTNILRMDNACHLVQKENMELMEFALTAKKHVWHAINYQITVLNAAMGFIYIKTNVMQNVLMDLIKLIQNVVHLVIPNVPNAKAVQITVTNATRDIFIMIMLVMKIDARMGHFRQVIVPNYAKHAIQNVNYAIQLQQIVKNASQTFSILTINVMKINVLLRAICHRIVIIKFVKHAVTIVKCAIQKKFVQHAKYLMYYQMIYVI